MSRQYVTDKLSHARDSLGLVKVERLPRYADDAYGFVLEFSAKWTLLLQIREGGYGDGYLAVRTKDIVNVRSSKTFESQFAQTQPFWPPVNPGCIDLSTTRNLLDSASKLSGLVGIQRENKLDGLWIGEVVEFTTKRVYVREVRPDATWQDEPLGYKLRSVTSVKIDDDYQRALKAVSAGTR